MKNKLFIIVACFSLLAVCGSADAQPSITDAAEKIDDVQTVGSTSTLNTEATRGSRTTRLDSFAPQTLLLGQRSETCGNNAVDQGEECEFITKEDGTVVEVVADTRVTANFAPLTCPEDTSCNPDTCRCEVVPICGDGLWDKRNEQCEAQSQDGKPHQSNEIYKMCVINTKNTGATLPELAEGSHYLCEDCMCVACGNGVKDPGEECDGTAGCNSECKMAPQPEPELQKITCTMTERGALAADYINEFNAQARAIMSEAKGEDARVDIFGESVYSEMLVQIEFPNASFQGEITDQDVLSKLAKSGDAYVTGTGFYQFGGPIYNDLSKVVRMDRNSLKQPLYLFPRTSSAAVSKGTKSLIGGSEVFITDLSADLGGVEILTDLSSAGFRDTEVTVVDANQGSLNGVLRFMVVPHAPTAVTKAEGEAVPQFGSKTAILDSKTWFAPGGWGDPSGELIHHDPNQVLAALQEVVNRLKAEGRQSEIDCSIVNLVMEQMGKKGHKYEAQMVSKFTVVSDALKVNSATGKVEMAEQQIVRPAFFTVHTEGGYGGAGTGPMSCSLATAQAHAPQILITLGMMVASIAGVGIIRRKKR